DIASIDVEKIGRTLRFHPQFQPAGTNVNFVEVVNTHTIRIRTYERGVEAETLACGTGSLAASLALAVRNIVAPPVTVITHSGIKLQFDFVKQADKFSQIKMNGPADIVFSGTINLDNLNQIFPPSFFVAVKNV
ncbi:MAG: diaminopimelate epimerase, partial [Candidatus Sumerlaeia bacterium]|nr:diaminopimelate epimerase [Candidatus Sumerlaeia bacterium]